MKRAILAVSVWLLAVLHAPAMAALNLRLDSIAINGNPVNAGGTTQFVATVTNIGDEVTVALVKVYLSSDAQLTTFDDQLLWFAQSPILYPGQSATVTQTVTLPARMATGEYYLGTILEGWYPDVDPGDNTASAPISVIGAVCTADALENDDTRAGARPVEVNDLQTRNHCDDPDDWASFQAIAGTRYGIQAARVGYNSSSLTLGIYAADGTLLASTPWPPPDYAKIIWTAPETAAYFVRVRPSGQWYDVGIGTEYSFVIADVLAELVVPYSDTYPKQGISGGTDWLYTSVANHGFVDSGPFDVGVHISASPNVTRQDRRIGFRRVDNLPPDRSMSISNVQIAYPADLPAGTYYIAAIADDGGRLAEYEEDNNTSEAAQVSIAGPACSPDAHEDDDLDFMARPVTVNEQVARNFCEDGFDWSSFEALAGRTYYVRAQYPPPYPGGPTSHAGTVEVYDLNGQRLGQASGVLAFTPSQSGTYRALVRGGSLSVNTYFFGVLDQLPDLAATLQWAMDTSIVPRGGVIDDGTWTVRNFGYADAPASTLGLYFSTDTSLTRTDQLLRSLPLPSIAPGGQEAQTFVRVPVPAAQPLGTYQYGAVADIDNVVAEFDEANNGTAIRQIDVVDPQCAPDAYEDDDLPGQARPLAVGTTQSRNFCEDGYDWVSADLQAGTTYAFEAVGDVASRVRLMIYDTEGRIRLVTGDTGFNNGDYAWASITAPATGRYYVLATTLDQYDQRTRIGVNMNYSLRVATCQPDAFEDDPDRASARPIALGTSQQRNHCEDAVDWASVSIATPGSYTIATSALGSAADTMLEIHSATSTAPLAGNDNTSLNNKASSVTYNFATAGTYYIRIAGKQRGANTGYTLSVQPAKGKK